MNSSISTFLLVFTMFFQIGEAQAIPSEKIIATEDLANYLQSNVRKELSKKGNISEETLAKYMRDVFSQRYFFDWQNTDNRFLEYSKLYQGKEDYHTHRALDHLSKYKGSTQWKLPFNYQNGKPVNAYALRHLARQHKMVDIAFYHFYKNKNNEFIRYFCDQQASLNQALHQDKYEKIKDGNGVYEAFRSGYRVLNWLLIHNLFLGNEEYNDKKQLTTIATLLQHGAHLYKDNATFKSGNHQTRGLSALAMISILLRDFEGTDKWYKHSMQLLEEHLQREINDDGFQFERTIHYHMSDIGNYFYVYQLAQISDMEVNPFWKQKLESLFTTLIKVAYPDKSAPVLSDDTDTPWGEKNDISGALTLGYLLFNNPEMGYFSSSTVDAKMYWYLTSEQLKQLNNREKTQPSYSSLAFNTTGYYITRENWKKNAQMMIISAGVDSLKPDHQHGDILGIQAMANGKVILPNYQVRYSLPDLELFKNSMVKNVALVDNELQGKKYTSNKGGSGFGKFKELPKPETISWVVDSSTDVFIGKHNGFQNVGVEYSRQVIYLKNHFWIVKDNFNSDTKHTYKQVWQGHYSTEDTPQILRSSFDNGSGLDIIQLNNVDSSDRDGRRGKGWSVISKKIKQIIALLQFYILIKHMIKALY